LFDLSGYERTYEPLALREFTSLNGRLWVQFRMPSPPLWLPISDIVVYDCKIIAFVNFHYLFKELYLFFYYKTIIKPSSRNIYDAIDAHCFIFKVRSVPEIENWSKNSKISEKEISENSKLEIFFLIFFKINFYF